MIVDTKFNAVVTRGWYREATLRSGYIYQIYAYLRSQENEKDPLAANALGLLLHPSVGDMVDERVVIQGHEIRFATVDLAASARDIRAQLLRVLDIAVAANTDVDIQLTQDTGAAAGLNLVVVAVLDDGE